MASDHSNDITLRDTMSGKELGALKGFKHSPGIMEFSANGQRLAAMDCYRVPGQMKIWDVPTRSEVPFTNKFVFYMAQDMAFSPDGNRIALSLAENIVVLDAKSGEVLMTLKGNDGMNGCLRFSPDGTRLASASLLGRQVKIWDVAPKAGGK